MIPLTGAALLAATVKIVLVMLGGSMIVGLLRLVRGPTLPDRVVALDLIGILVVGMIAVYAIREEEPVFLMPAIVLALIMFLGTVAFAYSLQRRVVS